MSMLDLDAFYRARLRDDPFDHLCVPGFVSASACRWLRNDFPLAGLSGSIPLGVAPHGPAFAALIRELRGPAVREAVAHVFKVDLDRRPLTFTVRERCRLEDGQVHVDSASKIITALIYMNPPWEAEGGRLRLLRSRDLDDVAEEVAPEEGTLLVFRRSDVSWHGHAPYEGPRRAIQMNWVRNGFYAAQEQIRHRAIAWWKRRSGTDFRIGRAPPTRPVPRIAVPSPDPGHEDRAA